MNRACAFLKSLSLLLTLATMLALALPIIPAQAVAETQGLVFSTSDGRFHLDSVDGAVYTGQPDAWSWDSGAKILILNGFEWITSARTALTIEVSNYFLTIDIEGENRIESTASGTEESIGIFSRDCSLTFIGGGTLYAIGSLSAPAGYGIGPEGFSIVQVNGPTINAKGSTSGIVAYLIYLDDGALNAEGNFYGIDPFPLAVSDPGAAFWGDLFIMGGTLTAQGGFSAISMRGDVQVKAFAYTYWTNIEMADPGGPGTVYNHSNPFYLTYYSKYVKIDATGSTRDASLTGTIHSYNPNTPATVQLLQDGVEQYKTDTTTAPGSGLAEQSFTFSNVAPGDYTLVVTKPGHASYTVRTITVGDEDIDLSRSRAVGAMTLPCGDLNGDGMINDSDLAVLWQAANYNKSVDDPGVNQLCDLNGDGMINDSDLAILWSANNYNKGAVVVG